jgi:hypothetical protein
MGKVARIYQARAMRVRPETARTRGDVGKLLVEGLQDATQEQLYDVTPLPVTRKMMKSIKPRFLGAFGVAVGYDSAVAPYAAMRVLKKGRSKMGGHKMDMNPAAHIRRNKSAQINALNFRGLRRILEG